MHFCSFILMLALLAVTSCGPAASAESVNLKKMRAQALDLVNDARGRNGLPRLQPGPMLDEAAQAHASDMLRRDYYSHRSPDGETVSDRFEDAGGSRWELVAENIAKCSGCPSPPGPDRVRELHEGWMNSPPHRENILRRGLERFGFGIAAGGSGQLRAVQTFAGPGTPRGVDPEQQTTEVGAQQQAEIALSAINRVREDAAVPPLQASDALSHAAAGAVPDQDLRSFMSGGITNAFEAMPAPTRASWQALAMLAASCGGCGERPTAVDVRYFVEQWLGSPDNRRRLLDATMTHVGVIIESNGEGLKVGVAVLGRHR